MVKESKAVALESLNKLNVQLELDINVGDINFNEGFVKMVDSYLKNNIYMNASALHLYSKLFRRSVARGRKKVQPGAVSRRVHKNGSRQKQDTSKKNITLPHRLITRKRKHNFSLNISKSEQCPKKSGRTMLTSTAYPLIRSKNMKN